MIFATTNPGKVEEFKRMLCPIGIEIKSLSDLAFNEEIEETGSSFEENAYIKAITVFKRYNLPVIADDSGLCIDVLNGFPGVHTARFDGDSTFIEKSQKILKLMENCEDKARGARFVSVVCVVFGEDGADTFEAAKKSKDVLFVHGECEGEIARKVRGDAGFGFDPIFLFGGRTFAELSPEEKDAVSHRGKSLRLLKQALSLRFGSNLEGISR